MTDDVLTRARAAGIGLASYPEIAAAAPDPPGVVFGYGMIDAHRIVEGVARLRRCLDAD